MTEDSEIEELTVDTNVSPESRQIQQLGRIDVPDNMWDEMGLSVEDEVMVRYNEDRDCIEVHNRNKVLSEAFDKFD
jgi:hypothetical protein